MPHSHPPSAARSHVITEAEDSFRLPSSPLWCGGCSLVTDLQPIGCQLVGVDCDGGGLIPDALERVLANWDEAKEGRPRPRVLCTLLIRAI